MCEGEKNTETELAKLSLVPFFLIFGSENLCRTLLSSEATLLTEREGNKPNVNGKGTKGETNTVLGGKPWHHDEGLLALLFSLFIK